MDICKAILLIFVVIISCVTISNSCCKKTECKPKITYEIRSTGCYHIKKAPVIPIDSSAIANAKHLDSTQYSIYNEEEAAFKEIVNSMGTQKIEKTDIKGYLTDLAY